MTCKSCLGVPHVHSIETKALKDCSTNEKEYSWPTHAFPEVAQAWTHRSSDVLQISFWNKLHNFHICWYINTSTLIRNFYQNLYFEIWASTLWHFPLFLQWKNWKVPRSLCRMQIWIFHQGFNLIWRFTRLHQIWVLEKQFVHHIYLDFKHSCCFWRRLDEIRKMLWTKLTNFCKLWSKLWIILKVLKLFILFHEL